MTPGNLSNLWISISSVINKFSRANRNNESPLKTWCLVHEKWSESEVAQVYLTRWDTMDYSLPRSSIHGIFQARVLEWVTISFSRGSSQPRDQTQVSSTVGRHFTIWASWEVCSINVPKTEMINSSNWLSWQHWGVSGGRGSLSVGEWPSGQMPPSRDVSLKCSDLVHWENLEGMGGEGGGRGDWDGEHM